jgi:hypothetical protein
MMRLPALILVLALMLAAGPAAAMAERLSGLEIRDWLLGNTVVGAWDGTPYRQLFRTDGTTIYKADGVALDEGRWWVTDAEYCSWWQGSGEACYQVLREGDDLIWRTKGVFKRNFATQVVTGDQLAPR